MDIDLGDDAHFDAFLTLFPYSINSEGWLDSTLVFSASDTSATLAVAPDGVGRAHIARELDHLGLQFENVLRAAR